MNNKRTYYRHNITYEKSALNVNIVEPDDVDFGRARTFDGCDRKFKQAGYTPRVVAVHYPDGSWLDTTVYTK